MSKFTSLLLLSCLVTLTVCAVVPPSPVFSIVRSQDELGGYHFNYKGGPTSRAEQRDHNGVVRGAYNLIDAEGNVQKYTYISDNLGYRLLSGTNLPVAPVHVYELPQAPVFNAELPVAPEFNPVFNLADLPQPVEETAEVQAARAEFETKFKAAAAAAAAAPDTP